MKKGFTYKEIADKLGVSIATAHNWVNKGRSGPHGGHNKIDAKLRDAAVKLRRKGLSLHDIALEIGCSQTSVDKIVKKHEKETGEKLPHAKPGTKPVKKRKPEKPKKSKEPKRVPPKADIDMTVTKYTMSREEIVKRYGEIGQHAERPISGPSIYWEGTRDSARKHYARGIRNENQATGEIS